MELFISDIIWYVWGTLCYVIWSRLYMSIVILFC